MMLTWYVGTGDDTGKPEAHKGLEAQVSEEWSPNDVTWVVGRARKQGNTFGYSFEFLYMYSILLN